MSETDGTKTIETEISDPAMAEAMAEAPAEVPEVEEIITITLGDENEETDDEEINELPDETEEEAHAPSWVKETRTRNKELNKTVKELQRQLHEAKARGVVAATL